MTSYSVLPTGPRTTVIATWSGEECDQSCKITTLEDPGHAARLAKILTRLSEDAWDAAAFLDTHPAIEEAIGRVIDELRDPEATIDPIVLTTDEGNRHAEAWSHKDLARLLAGDLPEMFTRPTTSNQTGTGCCPRSNLGYACCGNPTGMSGACVNQSCKPKNERI